MNRKVLIDVKLKQIDFEEKELLTEFTTEAKYYKKDNTIFIIYDESELNGMEGTTSIIKIEKNTVSIVRTGTVNSNIVLIEGETREDKYKTQYGIFELLVKTNKLNININENSGTLYAEYELELNKSKMGVNSFYLTIYENTQ